MVIRAEIGTHAIENNYIECTYAIKVNYIFDYIRVAWYRVDVVFTRLTMVVSSFR